MIFFTRTAYVNIIYILHRSAIHTETHDMLIAFTLQFSGRLIENTMFLYMIKTECC